ncbi:MAG: hypothetical protein JSU63_19660 [Phycisphaerales bacterium]|nr:MAG: hypothetical protein JSU63_19660 [Phycisphaerales bacterium]
MTCHIVMVVGVLSLGQFDPLTHVDSLSEQLRSPARLDISAAGTTYVADTFHNHIARYDSAGVLLGTWSVPEGPVGVGVHPSNGNYYVSLRDEGKVGIYVYDDVGETFSRTGFLGEGAPTVTFVRPTDIDIAPTSGRIFVVDPQGDRWYIFNSNGTLRATGGERGELNGQFKYPSAIAVDEANGRMLVADHDNFRVQIFTLVDDGEFTYATFERKFGYRLKYLPGGAIEGWMPRPLDLAVDSSGRIYVSDAVMGTVRLFDSVGDDLGKVIDYGLTPGALRTPCGLGISTDGLRLFVASTGSSSVEVFDTPPPSAGREVDSVIPDGGRPKGTNDCAYDVARRTKASASGKRRWADMRVPSEATADQVLALGSPPAGLRDLTSYDGPHMVEGRVICGRCHGIPDLPGGNVSLIEGQVNMCVSCHFGAGQAMDVPLHWSDLADPYGTNPDADDGQGRSHAWGVLAINASADSVGPVADSVMERMLTDEGNIKCATCHDQHSSDSGAPYLRMPNNRDQTCKVCHAPRNEGLGQRGTHPVGFDYPGGTGEFPADGDVAPFFIKAGNVECMTCHAPHAADSGGANDGEGDGILLRSANDESFCQTCHTEHSIHEPSGPWQPTCYDCHDFHDPDNENLALVGAQVISTPMTFQDDDISDDGLSDFIHSNHAMPSYDGICEVCHTDTSHHRNTSDGDHTHFVDQLCTACHRHSAGFMPTGGACDACHGYPPDGAAFPNTAGAHVKHMSDPSGPNIPDCFVCHAVLTGGTHMNGSATFVSGTDISGNGAIELDETDVCDSCHSPGGPFDGVAEGIVNWASGTGVSCEGCHDTGTSVINGVTAAPVAGDGTTWGYYTSGHGRHDIVACLDCHDTAATHFDGMERTYQASADNYQAGFRLKSVGGFPPLEIPQVQPASPEPYNDPPLWELCLSCHDRYALLGGPTAPAGPYYSAEFGTNFRSDASVIIPDGANTDIAEYSTSDAVDVNSHYGHIQGPPQSYDSDHDGLIDSYSSCVSCHNVHGSTSPVMMRDGKLIGAEPALNFSYVRYDRHDSQGGCTDAIIMTSAGGVPLMESHGGVMRSNSGPGDNGVCNYCHAGGAIADDPEYAVNCFGPDAVDYYREPLEVGCTLCHGQPPDGTAFPNTAGAHVAHITEPSGPQINNCFYCHAALVEGRHLNDLASFATGTDINGNSNIELDETDVCNACHTP